MSKHLLESKHVEDKALSANLARVTIPVTPFQQNCSLIWSQATKIGALIDPGGDLDLIKKSVKEQNVKIEKILLTHAHLDHAGGAKVLATELSIPIEGPHFEDKFWLEAMPEQSSRFGFPLTNTFMPDKWLEDGDKITFSDQTLEVLHCPGHTPGHVVFFHKSLVAFVGDVLFMGSIGRTDFPRGNHEQLIRSIVEKLWPLGDDVTFIPGHGPESTFGAERKFNPYVSDASLKHD